MLFAGWLAVLGVFGAMAWGTHVGTARRKWSAAGSRAGLELDSPRLTPPRLRGTQGGFSVVVSGSTPHIQILDVDPGFTLGRDSALARSIKPDIEIGEAEFDETIRVEGDRDFALGLLPAGTRRNVVDLVGAEGVEVKGDQMEAKLGDIEALPKLLPRMLHLAELLRRPAIEEIPARLASHALDDESPGFRLQAFRHLASEFHGTDEVPITARKLLLAPQYELRLEAARALLVRDEAEDRRRAGRALVDLAAQRDAEEWLRRLALELLAGSAEGDAAVHVARSLLLRHDEQPAMRRAALDALAHAGAVDALLEVEPSDDAKELETFAQALGQTGDLRAQPRLLEMLETPTTLVAIAAARSLGAVGDVRAVAALRRAAETEGVHGTPLLRVAERAIEEIQSRLGGSQAGELSLVVPAPLEGAVSPVEESGDDGPSGGELSLEDRGGMIDDGPRRE